jgi:hypothetical protein
METIMFTSRLPLKLALASAGLVGLLFAQQTASAETARAATAKMPPINDGLPMPGFTIDPATTAIVITDPQNDFLSPEGVTWGVVGQSITENGTVENLEALFEVADETGMPVFVSPHFYFEHDHKWEFEGTLETLMHSIGMFDRPHALTLEGFRRIRRRLARSLQALHQQWQDGRHQPAQSLRPGNQRPRPSASQGRHFQGHPRRHVVEPLHRIPHARADRAGLRSDGRNRCDRRRHHSALQRL